MIELIYNEDGKRVDGEKNLPEPKNVKKMGEPKDYKKIFIEDYVHTFLSQYCQNGTAGTKVAVLLGKSERSGGVRHLYIRSAYPVERVSEKQGKFYFTEKVWGDVYQECEKYFPDQEILGWFLSKPGFAVEKTAVLEETHRTYFSGADKVLFMMEPLQCECGFFAFDGNRFAKQTGYYICYEKNEPMREFLAEKNGDKKKGQAVEKADVAMANFRKILKEKQAKKIRKRKQALSYGVKTAIVLVFFVGAVALKNQTDQIRKLEEQMSSWSEKNILQETFSEQVTIEELPGNVEAVEEVIYEEPVQTEECAENVEVTTEDIPVQENEEEIPITEPEADPPAEEMTAEAVVYEEYRVQAGDTLAGICREKYGTEERLQEICALNEIEDGDYIQVGEIILLP